jgi:hypothetical protein
MYRDTTNVEPEMIIPATIGATGIVMGSLRKTFDRFTTKDSYTWNITHNTGSTAV